MNQHLRDEQGERRVRSTFPRAVLEHPTRPATSRQAGARTPTRADARRRRMATLLRFGAAGASGIAVNQLVLWAWVAGAGHHYLLGAVVATQASSPGTSA